MDNDDLQLEIEADLILAGEAGSVEAPTVLPEPEPEEKSGEKSGEKVTDGAEPEKSPKKDGERKDLVLVPKNYIHNHERMKRQRVAYQEKIAELKSHIESIKKSTAPIESYGGDVDKYVSDRTNATTNIALAERELAAVQASEEAAVHNFQVDSWNEKLADAKLRHPDFDEKIKAVADLPISPNASAALLANPLGEEVFYHLASNPDLITAMGTMDEEYQPMFIAQQAAYVQMMMMKNAPASQIQDNPVEDKAPRRQAPAPLAQVSKRTAGSDSDLESWADKIIVGIRR